MERLSSCYFCGAAPDQPLGTYHVSPETTADGTAITLCPTCHRKLDALLDEADTGTVRGSSDRDAAAHEQRQPDPNRNAETRSPTGRPAPGSGAAPADDGPTGADDQRTGDPHAPGDQSVSAGSGPSGGPSEDAGTAPSAGPSESAGPPDDPLPAHSDTASADTTPGAPPDAPQETPESGQGPTGGGEQTQPSDTAGGQEPSVSKQEYRKVLRLLQNRDEPVERGELESLAASAYGLTAAECAKIIGVAIEQGRVDQRGTELVLIE
jgi:hypothetical protein